MSADECGVDAPADQRLQCRVIVGLAGNVEALIGEASDAWGEPVAEEMGEGEDVVGETGSVGSVLLDPEVGFVVEQSVENMGTVSDGGGDDYANSAHRIGSASCLLRFVS